MSKNRQEIQPPGLEEFGAVGGLTQGGAGMAADGLMMTFPLAGP
jgi:hypothetical protein